LLDPGLELPDQLITLLQAPLQAADAVRIGL
jgi:hypothetical protein